MRRAHRLLAASLACFALGCTTALAQDSDACAQFKWPIGAERAALTAAGLPVVATGGTYPALGQAVSVTLAPEGDVAYTIRPTRKPKADPAYGAELAVADIGPGGVLQVTLSDEAWVDLVQGGKVLRAAGFSGKTGCPGVRKSVRFAVAPGPVAIAISDAAAATIRLDVTAAP